MRAKTNKVFTKTIQVQECFKYILGDYYTYLCYYGGRGGGKSESIAQMLVLRATNEPRLRILCMRETQNTIADSVKSILEKWIHTLELSSEFKIKADKIEAKNGSTFLFKGMQEYNAGNIKSIADINITWIEEAQYFSERSWELLVPSVIRAKNPKIILSLNPNTADDIVYKTFIGNIPPPKSYVKCINYYDNPFFKDSALDEKRKHDEKTMPYTEYQHTWLGALRTKSDISIFKNIDFRCDEVYLRENYIQLLIACDPATTNKDFSNEYGVVVMGLKHDGVIHLIEDASGNYSPNEFCQRVSELYRRYKAEMVVIETNNGGDFLKATLLLHDPILNVFEVRASTDKIRRSLPIASLGYMNRLKHLGHSNGDDKKIIRQMELMSLQGYNGFRGESPDRLDAYVWGCYVLANLNFKDTEGSFFNQPINIQERYFIIQDDIYFISYLKDTIGVIKCRVGKNKLLQKAVYIVDAFCLNSHIDFTTIKDANDIFIRDLPANHYLISEATQYFSDRFTNIHLYKQKKHNTAELIYTSSHNTNNANNDDRMIKLNESIKKNLVVVDTMESKFTPSAYNGDFGNLLDNALIKYYPNTKAYYPLLDLLYDTTQLLL